MHMLHSFCSKSSAYLLAFASARLVALRRFVAWWALDFEQEPCSIKALRSKILKGFSTFKDVLSILGFLALADLVSMHFPRVRG